METAVRDGVPRPAVQIRRRETEAGRTAPGEIRRRRQTDVEIVESGEIPKACRVARREQLEQRPRVHVAAQIDSKIERRKLQRHERLDHRAAAGLDADVSPSPAVKKLTACTSFASSSRFAKPTFQGPQISVICASAKGVAQQSERGRRDQQVSDVIELEDKDAADRPRRSFVH